MDPTPRRIPEGGPPRDPVATQVARVALLTALLLAALRSLVGGYQGLSGADGSGAWLQGPAMGAWSVPAAILLLLIGGGMLLATVGVLARRRQAQSWSVLAGTALLLWQVIQVMAVGKLSWVQPVTEGLALAVILLAWVLPAPEAEGERARRQPPRRQLAGQH